MNLTPSDIHAIILASGKGNRYGMPKSGASVDGLLFTQKISQSLLHAGFCNIFLAQDMDTDSMLETLQEAVSQISEVPELYMVWPVDHPLVKPSTIGELFLMAQENPDCVIKPEYQGQRGHPILIPSSLDLSKPGYHSLRELIRYSGIGTVIVPVEDPGIICNINKPEDLPDALKKYSQE